METLKLFFKDASQAFCNKFGLIGHYNSFNQIVGCKNRLIEGVVKLSYYPSKEIV